MTTYISKSIQQNYGSPNAEKTRDQTTNQNATSTGLSNFNNQRYLPTIRDAKTSGPVQKRRLKLSLDNQLQNFGKG